MGHVSENAECHVDAANSRLAHRRSSAAAPPPPPPAANCTAVIDPGGSWTRAMVDLYLMSVCDAVVRLGGSRDAHALNTALQLWRAGAPNAHA